MKYTYSTLISYLATLTHLSGPYEVSTGMYFKHTSKNGCSSDNDMPPAYPCCTPSCHCRFAISAITRTEGATTTRGWHEHGCTRAGGPDGARMARERMLGAARTDGVCVCEWAGWHDRERGRHEMARGDGASWNGRWANRLGRRVSMK